MARAHLPMRMRSRMWWRPVYSKQFRRFHRLLFTLRPRKLSLRRFSKRHAYFELLFIYSCPMDQDNSNSNDVVSEDATTSAPVKEPKGKRKKLVASVIVIALIAGVVAYKATRSDSKPSNTTTASKSPGAGPNMGDPDSLDP